MSEKYQYTGDMMEISGFGGDYEETCRKMVVAGLEWLDANPADPKFHSYKNIYGVIGEDNEHVLFLLHQAAISHVLLIRKIGWDKYMTESRARFKNEHRKH